jgi:hypothetical protein
MTACSEVKPLDNIMHVFRLFSNAEANTQCLSPRMGSDYTRYIERYMAYTEGQGMFKAKEG